MGNIRYTKSGKHAFEEGLSLVYSIGPTGDIAVILYPFRSEVNSPFEDSILLGVIPPDQAKLQKRMSRDVKDFVAYGYVTALDAKPTLSELARISYLRFIKPTHREKKYTPSASSGLIDKIKSASMSGIASGLLRFITLAAAVYLGARYGIQTK
ncbi:hypothetical protein [Methylobacterium sp. 275MFSha3.1]|uniref:hypothetical protein n=1 Tax=Methylobacterium sp. 275MFSha3.1 TaxID=1502746 RepID=UPI0011152EA4|nr:hypothetical protein [Methylobacterium sp. 275MFSha3.1]